MVAGFGTNYEPKDRKLVPGKLTAFRKFRFKPRPAFETVGAGQEWTNFASGLTPWKGLTPRGWQAMGDMAVRYGNDYAAMYYGANEWKPCLTAAGYGNVAYGPGEHEASCAHWFFKTVFNRLDYHTAPDPNCTCGFWAYYTPDQIDTGCGNDWMATAAVEVWGDVVLGEKGVRAQKMQIVGLLAPTELTQAPIEVVQAWHKMVGELSVPQYWNRAEFLEFHPRQDVSELIPKKPKPPQFPYVADGSAVSTINRMQLWQYLSTTTTNVVSTGTTSAYMPTYTYLPSTYVMDNCCICNYTVQGQTQEDADKLMAKHTIDCHMDLKGTSATNP